MDRAEQRRGRLERKLWSEVKATCLNALKNVSPTHLLDRDLLAAWASRPAELSPKPLVERQTQAHHRALPLVQSQRSIR